MAGRAGGARRARVLFRRAAVEGKELHARLKEGEPWPEGWPGRDDPRWEVKERKERVGFPFRPTRAHPLGLDASGRDVAARMLYALRTSLSFGLLLTALFALVFRWGCWPIAIAMQGESILKTPLCYLRCRNPVWIHDVTVPEALD